MRQHEDADGGPLTAEIVAVGSELLLGDRLDTNSAWLSGRLAELGIDVRRHTAVGDDDGDLVTAVARAADEHDVVVVTGGLGPTQDDVTRVAVARAAGVELERRDDLVRGIRAIWAQWGRDMPARDLAQADVPVGANVLTPVGTAPGFTIDINGALVVCLPGVPGEMRAMTDAEVVGLLQRRGGLQAIVTRVVRTSGAAESAVAQRCSGLVERSDHADDLRLSFLAAGGEVQVRVTARAADRAAAAARAAPIIDELIALLGVWVVGLDDQGAEHLIARSLRDNGWTLSVAESVTGGGIGGRLVTVPGASDWFAGGVIVYATPVKSTLADVPSELLDEQGPVSEDVAVALAAGVRHRLATDVGLAIVGVAGPTTQGDQAVGTVCLGVVLADGATRSRTVALPALDRADVQQRSATVALDYLRRRLARAVVSP